MTSTGKVAVAEFVATFALVFIGAGAVVAVGLGLDLTGVALAHGLVLAIMVSIIFHVSGGHVNPAVTIGLWVAGKTPTPTVLVYVVAQLLGAIAGAFLLKYLIPGELFDAAIGGTPQLAEGIAAGKGIVIEAATTFLLVFAVFGTAVDPLGPFTKTAGLTIGLVIAFDIMAFGPYTGAAMNPARWFGPALASGTWSDWFVWIVGPVAGAIIAAVVYQSVFLRDREPVTP
ncbi:MAG TPA: aquaporin [Actinomycetota bacterium]|nr:aquaporin [Actinomycetota bacterium]